MCATESVKDPAVPAGTCVTASGEKVQAPSEALTTVPTRAIKNILVAVDHEHHAALEMALSLAEPLQAQLAVVYVLEPVGLMDAENAYVYTQSQEQQRQFANDLLQEIHRALPEKARAFTHLREGNAAVEINNIAKRWPADLIVMGTHRRGPVARLIMGSTSQAVLRHGCCPVLFVNDLEAGTHRSTA
jgi:nucleotide-binding universal stress UspA family protein